MTSCADLDPFFDGELAKDAAANFREHLVDCSRCQVALRGRMQEETALGEPPERGAQHRPAGATPSPTVRPVVVGEREPPVRAIARLEVALAEQLDRADHVEAARDGGARRPVLALAEAQRELLVTHLPSMWGAFVVRGSADSPTASLRLEGIRSACLGARNRSAIRMCP